MHERWKENHLKRDRTKNEVTTCQLGGAQSEPMLDLKDQDEKLYLQINLCIHHLQIYKILCRFESD